MQNGTGSGEPSFFVLRLELRLFCAKGGRCQHARKQNNSHGGTRTAIGTSAEGAPEVGGWAVPLLLVTAEPRVAPAQAGPTFTRQADVIYGRKYGTALDGRLHAEE